MNVPQKTVSSNYQKMFSADKLLPGKEYSFTGTAMEGSAPRLMGKTRLFHANFVRVEGGDLKFQFNGMDLYIDPQEVKTFQYEGMSSHGGKTRKTNRKNRKQSRKTKHRKN